MDRDSLVRDIKGVGEKTQKLLEKLGIVTVGDLIGHYPRNYDVYEPPVAPDAVTAGRKQAVAAVLSAKPDLVSTRRMQLVTLKLFLGRPLTLKWYNMAYLRNSLVVGEKYVFRGMVTEKGGSLLMEQPEVMTAEEYEKKLDFMQPVYPLTQGVTNHMLIRLIGQALDKLDLPKEFLDEGIRRRYHLAEYNFAVSQIHFPENKACMLRARQRLAFDEFYLFALAIRLLKENQEAAENLYKIEGAAGETSEKECTGKEAGAPAEREVCRQFRESLPYPLTGAQLNTWRDIRADMASDKVMNRLVQGDVGSGKTVIAQLALLAAADCGFQGCLMAPTEVLARQHYESFVRDFEHVRLGCHGSAPKIVLLTGSMTAKEKRLAYEKIESHEADIIIGTHALIQERAVYDRLALVITDEQHRFGVRQREILSSKGSSPHVLVMSATPIPRTLAVILYGDLDISVIDELPARRLPIKNCAVGTGYRPTAWHFIEQQVRLGHQAYVICPMVEESEMLDAENVIDYTEKLRRALPEDISVCYLHGKQKPKEKNEIMERFAKNEIQVLVSTTVVEVGVNVPNATVMMVEDAQRFGLAQLHQLRGRVGRGDAQSYCIFMNTSDKDNASERLDVLVKSNDGFFIAGEDLRLRGPGDLFGLKQSGLMEFKIGDLFNDLDLLKAAADAARDTSKEMLLADSGSPLRTAIDRYMRRTLESLVL